MVINVTAVNFITFVNSAASNIHGGVASSQLTLTGVVDTNNHIVSVSTPMFLHSNVLPHLVTHLTTSQNIVFVQDSEPRVNVVSANSYLILAQSIELVPYGLALNMLVFNQSVSVTGTPGSVSTLSFIDSANFSIHKAVLATNVLTFVEGASVYGGAKPANTYFPSPNVTFVYGNQTFVVQNPDFGNTDTLEFTRIARMSRGNDDLIARDPDWPSIERLNISFDLCNQTLSDKFRDIIRSSLGDFVEYTHVDGVTYLAVILNPDTPLSQPKRQSWKVNLNLEVIT